MSKKIIFLPIMICLILFSCSVPDDEIVAPVWNISLKKIPLLKADTVKVGEELQSENVKTLDESDLLHVTFTDTTEFSVDEQLNLVPDITDIEVPLVSIEQELFEEPPEGLENLQFDQVNIIIRSLNVPFGFLLHLDFTSTKKGVTKTLSDSIIIPEGNIAPHSINIAELLNDMPEKIKIDGWMKFLEDITITESAEYNIEYKLDVPLRFSFTESSTIEETEELDLDTDARDAIEKNLINVSLEGTIVNETPLSGKIDFYVGVTENNINNLLFTVDLPQGRTEGTINVSVDKQRLNYLINANWSKVVVTVNSVFDAEIRVTDHIIIKNVTLSGTGKIDTSD